MTDDIITFDVLDDQTTFVIPADVPFTQAFRIQCGDASCLLTLQDIIDNDGVVELSTSDGLETFRISLDQFMAPYYAQQAQMMDYDVHEETVQPLRVETLTNEPMITASQVQTPLPQSTQQQQQQQQPNTTANAQLPPRPRRTQRSSFPSYVWSLLPALPTYCSFQPLPGLVHHSAVVNTANMHTYVFGGSNGKGEESELYVYNSSIEHWKRVEASYKPWGRHGHAAVSFQGFMYLFGGVGLNGVKPLRNAMPGQPIVDLSDIYCKGYTNAPKDVPVGFLNDMWSYHYETNVWKNVANAMHAQVVHHAAVVLKDGRVISTGGIGMHSCAISQTSVMQLPIRCNTTNCPRNAAYVIPGMMKHFCEECQRAVGYRDAQPIQLQSFTWHVARTQGVSFPARYHHTAVCHENNVVVFGGCAEGAPTTLMGDLLVLHTETMEWEAIPTTPSFPEPRSGHSACVVDDVMYLIGGNGPFVRGHSKHLHDAYMLDLNTYEWRSIEFKVNVLKGLSHHTVTRITSGCGTENTRLSLLVFGGDVSIESSKVTNVVVAPHHQTYFYQGHQRTVRQASVDPKRTSSANAREEAKKREEKFKKWHENTLKWAQSVDKDVESLRAADQHKQHIAANLSNLEDQSPVKTVASEVRGICQELNGVKETIQEKDVNAEVKRKLLSAIGDVQKIADEMARALTKPDDYKLSLTQSVLLKQFAAIDKAFEEALTHANDGRLHEDVRESFVEEITQPKKSLKSSKKQICELFGKMTSVQVKRMMEYVKKHEISMLKTTVKVKENFKLSVWKGALDCGKKVSGKDDKAAEAAWSRSKVTRLQQSFPHTLPESLLNEMMIIIQDATAAGEASLQSFATDQKDTSREASSLVQAAKHAAQTLKSILEKEKVLAKNGQDFRQALFYGKYKEFKEAADKMKVYIHEHVQNIEEAIDNAKILHQKMELFGKKLMKSCEKIVLEAAKKMYDQGLKQIKEKQRATIEHSKRRPASAAGHNNKKQEGGKGSSPSPNSGKAAKHTPPSVDELRKALGLPELKKVEEKVEAPSPTKQRVKKAK
eukprot:PhF_6_TR40434/c0_g1_i2/m.60304